MNAHNTSTQVFEDYVQKHYNIICSIVNKRINEFMTMTFMTDNQLQFIEIAGQYRGLNYAVVRFYLEKEPQDFEEMLMTSEHSESTLSDISEDYTSTEICLLGPKIDGVKNRKIFTTFDKAYTL